MGTSGVENRGLPSTPPGIGDAAAGPASPGPGVRPASPASRGELLADFESAGESGAAASAEEPLPLYKLIYHRTSFDIPEEILCGRISVRLLKECFNLTPEESKAVIVVLSNLGIIPSYSDSESLEVTPPDKRTSYEFLYAPELSGISIEIVYRVGRYLQRTADLAFFQPWLRNKSIMTKESRSDLISHSVIDLAQGFETKRLFSAKQNQHLMEFLEAYLIGNPFELDTSLDPSMAMPLLVISDRLLMPGLQSEVEAFILSHMALPELPEEIPQGSNFIAELIRPAKEIDEMLPRRSSDDVSALGSYLRSQGDIRIFSMVIKRILFNRDYHESTRLIEKLIPLVPEDEEKRSNFLLIALSALESHQDAVRYLFNQESVRALIDPKFIMDAVCFPLELQTVECICAEISPAQITTKLIRESARWVKVMPVVVSTLWRRIPANLITAAFIQGSIEEGNPPLPADAIYDLCRHLPNEQISLDLIRFFAQMHLLNPDAVSILCRRIPANLITADFIQGSIHGNPPLPTDAIYDLCQHLPDEQISLILIWFLTQMHPVHHITVGLLSISYARTHHITLPLLQDIARWYPPYPRLIGTLTWFFPGDGINLETIKAIAQMMPPHDPYHAIGILCRRFPASITLDMIRDVFSWDPPVPEIEAGLCLYASGITSGFVEEVANWAPPKPEALVALCRNSSLRLPSLPPLHGGSDSGHSFDFTQLNSKNPEAAASLFGNSAVVSELPANIFFIQKMASWDPLNPEAIANLCNILPAHLITLALIRGVADLNPSNPQAVTNLCRRIGSPITFSVIEDVNKWDPPHPEVVAHLCYPLLFYYDQITFKQMKEIAKMQPPNLRAIANLSPWYRSQTFEGEEARTLPNLFKALSNWCSTGRRGNITLDFIQKQIEDDPFGLLPSGESERQAMVYDIQAILCEFMWPRDITPDVIQAVARWDPPNPEALARLCRKLEGPSRISADLIRLVSGLQPPNLQAVINLCSRIQDQNLATRLFFELDDLLPTPEGALVREFLLDSEKRETERNRRFARIF